MVFAPGEYIHGTDTGRRLLAHELTHVVQQGTALPIAISLAHQAVGRILRPVSSRVQRDSAESAAAGSAMQTILPGYSQEGDTCGAASLVTALMVWDREHSQPDAPHEVVVTAINIILTWLVDNHKETIDGWNDRGFDGEALYEEIINTLEGIRDNARQPSSTIPEVDYQNIGLALYALYIDRTRGLNVNQIENLHRRLGLYTGESEAGLISFRDIVDSSLLRSLEPGQIAHVSWYVRTSEPDPQGHYTMTHHAFIIGRFQSGEWFLSDQGQRPPTEIAAPDYITLMQELVHASNEGRSRIHTGQLTQIIFGAWTGVKLLAGPESVMGEAAGLVPSETYLGEADAGVLTNGDSINSGLFVSRHYIRSDAHIAAGKVSRHGVLIVEMPEGVFNVYETDMVRTPNVGVQSLDSSAGGLLTQQTFFSVELVLTDGNQANLLHVY